MSREIYGQGFLSCIIFDNVLEFETCAYLLGYQIAIRMSAYSRRVLNQAFTVYKVYNKNNSINNTKK